MRTHISNPYFQISEQNIILRGSVYGHNYIVYCLNQSVNVNTYYKNVGKDLYDCCAYYDRKLCRTVSEFQKMSKERIEAQAYNSWMDGAHS